jgi:polar amino acid transport system permease protein
MAETLNFIKEILPNLMSGTLITVRITLVGVVLGMAIGLPAALARVYGPAWLRRIAISYIEIFRGTPLLAQLFVVYYGLPQLGLTFSRFTAAYLTLGLHSGAYQAEYFRGAIQAIGVRQMMAARALGMSRLKAIRHIILPQAIRLVIPAWSNEPIAMMKATAIVFLIAVPDLMGEAKVIAYRYFNPTETYLIAAAIYIIIVLAITGLMKLLEVHLRIPGIGVAGDSRH